MDFFRILNKYDYIVIALFVLFYLGYFWRVYQVGKVLKFSLWKFLTKLSLRLLILLFLFFALLGPNFGDIQSREVKAVGRDIFIAIDLSKSMDAVDMVPSRLLKTKYEVKKLINSFKSDRVGLIVFTSEAYIQCPLTNDHSAFDIFLETVSTKLISARGTDFSAPFELAIDKFKKDDENLLKKSSAKIVILVSDGEDFGDNTKDVVEKMKNDNIKLFCLGIGTKKGGKIKTRSGYKMDNTGKEVISKLESESLEDIAEITDGKYYEISESRNDINNLVSEIKKIKGEVRSVKLQDTKTDKYYYFLSLASLLFFVDTSFKFNTFKKV